MRPYQKGKRRPPEHRAFPTLQTVDNVVQDALLPSARTREEPPTLPALETCLLAAALRAANPLTVDLGAEDDHVSHKMKCFILIEESAWSDSI